MRKKTLIVVAIGLGLVGTVAVSQQPGPAPQQAEGAPEKSPEQAQVHEIFQTYKNALLQGDGETAARMVDADTFEYFRSIQSLALEGDAEAVKARAFVDRLLVVTMRHELDRETLASMGLEDLLRHAIESGWIAKASILQLGIGEVTVEGAEASAVALVNGTAPPAEEGIEPLAYEFVREEGEWKFRFSSLVEGLNHVISAFTAQMGANEDDMIFTLVQALSGRQVLPEIWDAPEGAQN